MKNNDLLTLEKYISQTTQLHSLTESECRLDAYIQAHFNELPFHGIVDLARNASVSKATVGRFLNKLGFTGYSAFRRELEEALSQQKLVPPFELASRAQGKAKVTTAEIVSEFNKNVTMLFDSFKDNIDIDSLDEFIDLILDTDRHLYVIGPSSSHAMAKHFTTLINYFRDRVTLLSVDVGDLPKALLNLSSKDVLIAFSYYRFNRVVIRVTEWFRKKDAVVVVVTNSESNPYGKFCNLQFVLPSDVQSVFKSRIIGFFFVELVLHLAYEKGEGEGNFEQLEELFVFFELFSPLPK
ncbi:MurR/RpiR family transcriptional regulator [Budvicia aquatica]|uniref:DNA-binding transcriptional regulator HexR n=1 Tax=Budvicia aquatica TaxID=82979 RepID=A0A2C6CN86_9GAMM|nr:MurR/RpiR family transcriptional regulator [Budvicia aquatica]MBP9643138.1 MurR/RpiR family transcriptional regulator [Budvicia sp.]PHI28119.1 MurR/RpiR family transcriptional regulator [Budvicia aquatica]GKX50904.1 N-acetylmannosamine kinase [Budvicia aquatica]VFS45909.1 DNA-binding transcriptional regulator HexR [Budvicia aquatica]